MLKWSVEERVSASKALSHAFFKEGYKHLQEGLEAEFPEFLVYNIIQKSLISASPEKFCVENQEHRGDEVDMRNPTTAIPTSAIPASYVDLDRPSFVAKSLMSGYELVLSRMVDEVVPRPNRAVIKSLLSGVELQLIDTEDIIPFQTFTEDRRQYLPPC
jgi:hypothetical protein